MPSPIDPKWVEALKLPLRIMLGVALGALAILVLDHLDVLQLETLGQAARPSMMIVAIGASALSITGIGALFYDVWISKRRRTALEIRRDLRKRELEKQAREEEQAALSRLDFLSEEELHYLAECLRKQSQSFTTWVHSSGVASLMAKRLVYSPGGTHHQDHYPFVIEDFAWEELRRRANDFLERDDANRRNRR